MMKRILIGLLFLFLATASYATGQDGDIIYINGVCWQLLGKPVCGDSLLCNSLKAVLPAERSKSTANWDGFTSYWSIAKNKLCLDSIRCEHYDANRRETVGERIPAATLERVFKNYVNGHRIIAGWLTEDIRIAKGQQLYYEHSGFERNYEEEQIISIVKGKVTGRKEYHNFVLDGFSFDGVDNSEIRKRFPLQINKFPELANMKRIWFRIEKARVDGQGNLVECEVKVVKSEGNQRLADEMARLMKAYRPWKVSYINGEYRATGIEGWTIPYIIE